MRVWSILMNIALVEGLRPHHLGNPCRDVRVTTPPSRSRRPTFDEVMRFCEVAEREGRRSMKLVALLAFDLNQREGDVLTLTRSACDGQRMTIRQHKKGALVKVRVMRVLRDEIAAINHGHAVMVISETTGLPYKEDNFRHEFRRLADLAGVDFQFRDLRRGGLTETGDAGATLLQLHATSGHKSLQGSKPYLIPTVEQADAAIKKRESFRARRQAGAEQN
jgi:hypothetical protein